MLLIATVLILIVLAIAAAPVWGYSRGWGPSLGFAALASVLVLVPVAVWQIFLSGPIDDQRGKTTYTLCGKTEDAQRKLPDMVRRFAEEQGADLSDRSAGVLHELTALKADTLDRTGGNPILMTVTKPGEYRLTVSNLNLREKFVLSVRSLDQTAPGKPVARFLDDLRAFWTITESAHNVMDDPPCR